VAEMLKKLTTTTITLILTTALAGCNGAYHDYSDADLKDMYRKCDYSKLTAAGAQRCNNIKKECLKRKEDKGLRC